MSNIIETLMNRAFDERREQRSEEYKNGVRTTLEFYINGGDPVCPYLMGTAAADAFISGMDEGQSIFRVYKQQQPTSGAVA